MATEVILVGTLITCTQIANHQSTETIPEPRSLFLSTDGYSHTAFMYFFTSIRKKLLVTFLTYLSCLAELITIFFFRSSCFPVLVYREIIPSCMVIFEIRGN